MCQLIILLRYFLNRKGKLVSGFSKIAAALRAGGGTFMDREYEKNYLEKTALPRGAHRFWDQDRAILVLLGLFFDLIILARRKVLMRA